MGFQFIYNEKIRRVFNLGFGCYGLPFQEVLNLGDVYTMSGGASGGLNLKHRAPDIGVQLPHVTKTDGRSDFVLSQESTISVGATIKASDITEKGAKIDGSIAFNNANSFALSAAYEYTCSCDPTQLAEAVKKALQNNNDRPRDLYYVVSEVRCVKFGYFAISSKSTGDVKVSGETAIEGGKIGGDVSISWGQTAGESYAVKSEDANNCVYAIDVFRFRGPAGNIKLNPGSDW